MHCSKVQEALVEVGPDKAFAAFLNEAGSWLPDIAQWSDSGHEVQLTERIALLTRPRAEKSAEHRTSIVLAGLRAIAALAVRRPAGENPYGELVFDEGYFSYYPINLRSFDYHVANTWSSLGMREVLRWLLLNWGIEVHLGDRRTACCPHAPTIQPGGSRTKRYRCA
jgi:hypothetical protein